MISESEFVTSIMFQLGLVQQTLPFKEPPEQIIRQVIKHVTLPTFSQFSPMRRQFSINMMNLKRVNMVDLPVDLRNQENAGQFFIPEHITQYPKFLFISNVTPDYSGYDQDNNLLYSWNAGNTYQMGAQVVDATAFSNYVGQMGVQQHFEFIRPNRIYLRGYYGMICMVAGYAHETIQTVDDMSYDMFMELAILDVENYIYQLMKHYNGIQSAYGTINLRIEEWQSADNDRKALIQTWRERYGDGKYDWVAYL